MFAATETRIRNPKPGMVIGHSDAKMGDVDDNFDDDAQIKLITNEENEEARDSFPDVSPGKVCIPWKLLHLLGTRSERKTELCVSKHLKIFSFGGK